ncbi:MAG: hypothetical protein CL662_00765 [Bacteroidetes bacterium]|nr:hypothetical protein [Bacteroidota bacterium]|tara:strand:+ start:176 stop:988 length:813 start_codon:yes stop_codon:yes gene_type:complete
MAVTIPTEIEKDIKSGKARYRNFTTGYGGQSVLNVDQNSYIIIYGYEFNPMGGGATFTIDSNNARNDLPDVILGLVTQQVTFYNGESFHPFVHHVGVDQRGLASATNKIYINNTPIFNSLYLISDKNVTTTVGGVAKIQDFATGTIDVTNNTPEFLTFGGSADVLHRQSQITVGNNRLYQPNKELGISNATDYYGGGIPPNADSQDQFVMYPRNGSTAAGTAGLYPPFQIANVLQTTLAGAGELRTNAGFNYFLTLHYALYTNQKPGQLG